jgi:Zn-dependent protease with chaperone function
MRTRCQHAFDPDADGLSLASHRVLDGEARTTRFLAGVDGSRRGELATPASPDESVVSRSTTLRIVQIANQSRTVFFVLASLASASCIRAGDAPSERVTRFDLATREDLLFARLLEPLLRGSNPTQWSLVNDLSPQVGEWAQQFVDARQIAGVITEAFPIEGQPPFRPLDELVSECARILCMTKPIVHVRNHPLTRAYVVRANDQDHLVVTSALLNLYEQRPNELKFVIGRELGHSKCGHQDLKNKAYGLLSAFQAVNESVVPDKFQAVLPTLAVGRLYTWCRESEISADRAGLLCCGEPNLAYDAIMRMQHGLRPDSPFLNPNDDSFDADRIIRGFQQWQYRPFVKLIIDVKRHAVDFPFVPERLAALKAWAATGGHRSILARPPYSRRGDLIEIVSIDAYALAADGESVDPYVIVYDGDDRVLQTRYGTGLQSAHWEGFKTTDKSVAQPRATSAGRPLFFEIWDADFGFDTLLGGFVICPDSFDGKAIGEGAREAEYTSKIVWDWKEPRSVARQGFARVRVRFTLREASTTAQTTREAK